MIGALEDAEDYKEFEAVISADYDAQSAVERELVLRLASLLWRLRRATTIETGLFEIQADMGMLAKDRHVDPNSRQIAYALFRPTSIRPDGNSVPFSATSKSRSPGLTANPSVELARCFLRLANLPNFALDRLSRYERALWRQVGQTLFALDALDRRKPQERSRRFGIRNDIDLPNYQHKHDGLSQ